MNIRVHQDPLPGASVSELSRSEPASASSAGRTKAGSDASPPAGDRVEISSLSGSIVDSLAVAAAGQSAKVQHLAALYSSGQYHVDSACISRSLVAQSIGLSGPSDE